MECFHIIHETSHSKNLGVNDSFGLKTCVKIFQIVGDYTINGFSNAGATFALSPFSWRKNVSFSMRRPTDNFVGWILMFLSWSGMESSLAKHPVVWLLYFALCQTCTILLVLGRQFLEGIESSQ